MEYSYSSEKLPDTLSDTELKHLFSLKESGCKKSRNKIISHNMRLVYLIINKKFRSYIFPGSYLDFDDLISLGSMGLIRAVDGFDLNKNIKFSSYATRCIENEILMDMRKITTRTNPVSVDSVLVAAKDGTSLTLLDMLTEDNNIESNFLNKELLGVIKESLSELDETDKKIIDLKFGLNNNEEHTYKEIAEILGISNVYVSMKRKKVLKKLSTILKDKGFIEKGSLESKKFERMNNTEKAKFCGDLILSLNIDIPELSILLEVSNTSIRSLVLKSLPVNYPELYVEVKRRLDEFKNQKIESNLIKKEKAKQSKNNALKLTKNR